MIKQKPYIPIFKCYRCKKKFKGIALYRPHVLKCWDKFVEKEIAIPWVENKLKK